jgi:hypothetical protein
MKHDERILTLHPSGKKGVNINRHKYEQVKKSIVSKLRNKTTLSFDELTDLVDDDLKKSGFEGKPLWYIVTVKLDLEARKIIGRIPGVQNQKGSHKLKLLKV